MERPSRIVENTSISLGVVALIVGAVMYLSNDHALGQTNARDIESLQQHQDQYIKDIEKIDRRLSHIEGALGVKFERQTH